MNSARGRRFAPLCDRDCELALSVGRAEAAERLSTRRDQPIRPQAIRVQPVTRSGTQWRGSVQPK
jgi:hypothetical protein